MPWNTEIDHSWDVRIRAVRATTRSPLGLVIIRRDETAQIAVAHPRRERRRVVLDENFSAFVIDETDGAVHNRCAEFTQQVLRGFIQGDVERGVRPVRRGVAAQVGHALRRRLVVVVAST